MSSRTTTIKRKSNVRRQRDPIPWKYCFLTLICGLFLVAGFFWAARSHFSSMDYGMKNAKLRKQIDELKSENQRLTLSRELALTPSEIKEAAKKLGFTTMTAKNIESIDSKSADEVKTEVTESKKKDNIKIPSIKDEVLKNSAENSKDREKKNEKLANEEKKSNNDSPDEKPKTKIAKK